MYVCVWSEDKSIKAFAFAEWESEGDTICNIINPCTLENNIDVRPSEWKKVYVLEFTCEMDFRTGAGI